MLRDSGKEALDFTPNHVVLLVSDSDQTDLIGVWIWNKSYAVEVKEVGNALCESIDIDVLVGTNHGCG